MLISRAKNYDVIWLHDFKKCLIAILQTIRFAIFCSKMKIQFLVHILN